MIRGPSITAGMTTGRGRKERVRKKEEEAREQILIEIVWKGDEIRRGARGEWRQLGGIEAHW